MCDQAIAQRHLLGTAKCVVRADDPLCSEWRGRHWSHSGLPLQSAHDPGRPVNPKTKDVQGIVAGTSSLAMRLP